ncbi:tetratricopeptide repeat protein, partial [Actinophytocola sp.]|uniref:tetratricopeptide repeat protein n=1 Tax=Actinophytocola sp. TaxID=1872138 RepID=UPI002D800A4A
RSAVRAVFSWSIQHLSPRGAEAFAVLGVHPAPTFDAHGLAALLDADLAEARRLLDALARAHLAGGPADRPHPVEVDVPAALGRLHDYYLAAAALAMERLYPGEADRRPPVSRAATPTPDLADAAAARTWLDAELANLESVAAHSAAHGWPAHTVRLSAILFRYLDGAHDSAALNIHGQARAAARSIGDRAGEAYALNALGAVHTQASRHDLAAAQLWEAYTLFVDEGDQVGQGRALGNLGSVEERAGKYGSAAEHYEQALARYRATGDWTGEAHALTRLGTVEARLGRDDAALDHLRRALSLHQRAGHRFGEAWALTSLGELEAGAGRLGRAADLHSQALALFRALGHRTSEAWALDGLGTTETLRGHHESATRLHSQALALFRENGDRDGEAWARNGLGESARAAGALEQSRSHHADALVLAGQTGAGDQQARAHLGLARAHLTTNPTAARHHYEQAAAIYTDLGMTAANTIRAELTTLDNPAPTT